MFSVLSAALLSACASTVNENTLAVIKDKRFICKDEISKTISLMLNSDKVIFDKRSFEQSSYLYLNNQKVSELKIKPSNSSKYVTFVLYKEDGRCMLALIDKNHKIEKSHQLTKCSCIKSKSL
jgi:hypothetical protein